MFATTLPRDPQMERYQKLCMRMSRLEAQVAAEVAASYARMYATINREMKAYYDDVSEDLKEEEDVTWDAEELSTTEQDETDAEEPVPKRSFLNSDPTVFLFRLPNKD
jgi:hypothetical protein